MCMVSLLPGPVVDELKNASLVVFGHRRADRGVGLGFQVVPAGHGVRTPPVRQIVVGGRRAGAHGGGIDRLDKTLGQFALRGLPARLDNDLGRNVAPENDDELGQGQAPG